MTRHSPDHKIIEEGRRRVVPFVHTLHALHYPGQHTGVRLQPLEGGRDSIWIRATEERVAALDTTNRQKSEAVGFVFRSVGEAVMLLYEEGDLIEGLHEFCRETMTPDDIQDLVELQEGRGFSLSDILPPEDVVHSMFRHFSKLHHDDCPALEGYIRSLAIGEGQQLRLIA